MLGARRSRFNWDHAAIEVPARHEEPRDGTRCHDDIGAVSRTGGVKPLRGRKLFSADPTAVMPERRSPGAGKWYPRAASPLPVAGARGHFDGAAPPFSSADRGRQA